MTTLELRNKMEQTCKHYTSEHILDLIGRIMKDGNYGALNASESITALQVLESELELRNAK